MLASSSLSSTSASSRQHHLHHHGAANRRGVGGGGGSSSLSLRFLLATSLAVATVFILLGVALSASPTVMNAIGSSGKSGADSHIAADDARGKGKGRRARESAAGDDEALALAAADWKRDRDAANAAAKAQLQQRYVPPPRPRDLAPPPTFSIVMLTYKSPKSLEKTLHSLFTSHIIYHPWLVEVIVYFQARRLGRPAPPHAPAAAAAADSGSNTNSSSSSRRKVIGDDVPLDFDAALVKGIYDYYQRNSVVDDSGDSASSSIGGGRSEDSMRAIRNGAGRGSVRGGKKSAASADGASSTNPNKHLPYPKPFVVLGDGSNLPVALATEKAVQHAKGELIMYLECDRPVVSRVSEHDGWEDEGDGDRDGSGGTNGGDNSVLPAFAYAQIATAVDHVYYRRKEAMRQQQHQGGGAASGSSGGSPSPSSSSSNSTFADVFRFQLYSGPHIDDSSPLHRRGRGGMGDHHARDDAKMAAAVDGADGGVTIGSPAGMNSVVPAETYGVQPHKHCLATPWYHPSSSSSSSYSSSSSSTLSPSLRDICANPKAAKKKMGNVFSTAYCKHWRKLNHINSANVMATTPAGGGGGGHADDGGETSSLLLPFSLPQQDMCDSFCFLDWALLSSSNDGRGAASSSSRSTITTPLLPPLWKGRSIPKFAARGIRIDHNYTFSKAMATEVLLGIEDDFSADDGSPNVTRRWVSSHVSPIPYRLLRSVNRSSPFGPMPSSSSSYSSSIIPAASIPSIASNLPVVCMTSEDCNWTNQPTMYRRQWWLDNIAAPCREQSRDFCVGAAGRGSAVRQELYFVKSRAVWAEKRYRVCLGRGLFVHDEVDNRE